MRPSLVQLSESLHLKQSAKILPNRMSYEAQKRVWEQGNGTVWYGDTENLIKYRIRQIKYYINFFLYN